MKRRKQIADINMVPFIDVMLVLLIIFMITTPLLTQGVEVDLPSAEAKAIDTKAPEPIVVTVDADGQYFLNSSGKTPLNQKQLLTRVAAEIRLAQNAKQQKQVLVKGDANVNYGKVVHAMVLLQQAGAETVGLLTQPDESA